MTESVGDANLRAAVGGVTFVLKSPDIAVEAHRVMNAPGTSG